MLNIIIAPDSFKESYSSVEVAEAIYNGFHSVFPDANFVMAPMADGGTGTLAALAEALPLKKHTVTVAGPLFQPQQAHFAVLEQEGLAIIEMAQASGLHLLTIPERNPLLTTTYGTGELILHALDAGFRRFIIGLGGSATCDGGMGALSALGIQFKDEHQQNLKPMGANLSKIVHIETAELDPRIVDCEFVLAHDVDNSLLGLTGALMYAPQKGATKSDLEMLTQGFEHYASHLQNTTQKNVCAMAGTGAAGGLAAGLFAFLNACLTPGAHLVMELTGFADKMDNAQLVITGEGQLDSQSLHGKTTITIAKMAQSKNIPVIAFVGQLKGEMQDFYQQGLTAAFSIAPGPITLETCIKQVQPLLVQSSHNVARLFKAARTE